VWRRPGFVCRSSDKDKQGYAGWDGKKKKGPTSDDPMDNGRGSLVSRLAKDSTLSRDWQLVATGRNS